MATWHEQAKCAGDELAKYSLDEAPYFVEPHHRAEAAAALCAGCPVMEDCAADALLHHDRGVVRAGEWLRYTGANPGRDRRDRLSARMGLNLRVA